jgi:hypothetical protein
MSDPTLSPEIVASLREMPRPAAARSLLLGSVGPLDGAGFPSDVATLAYLLWVVFGRARVGMLSGRPSWEAAETFAARVRSASTRAAGLHHFGLELMRSLRVKPESLHEADQVWWRGECAMDADGGVWRRFKRRERIDEAVVAFGLLREWMWEVREDRKEQTNG